MDDPFATLGVPLSADDNTIRKAYLNNVREAPPERDPDGFHRIRTAYEAIANEQARLRFHLFSERLIKPSSLLMPWFKDADRTRPSRKQLLEILAGSLGAR